MTDRHLPTATLTLAALFAWFAVACDDKPSDLRPWQASDHHHQAEGPAAPAGQAPQTAAPPQGSAAPASAAGMPDLSAAGITPVVTSTWSRQCAMCHGQVGKGDGPMASSMSVPDFSDPSTLATDTVETLSPVIKNGRGSMPGFNLPDATLAGLSRFVLMMGGHRPAPPAEGAPNPPGSAPQGASSSAPGAGPR